jgi:hypothetical protein
MVWLYPVFMPTLGTTCEKKTKAGIEIGNQHVRDTSPEDQSLPRAELSMALPPTPFLTPAVRELFNVTADDAASAPAGPLLGPDGRVDWVGGPLAASRVSAGELLPGMAHYELEPEQLRRCARRLAGLAARAPAALEQLTPAELSPRLAHAHRLLLSATTTDADASAALSALQLVLAELEARVSDLYYASGGATSDGSSASEIPLLAHAKLKEMLRSPQLRAILEGGASLALHVLVGPLHGVCLRNLAWHGCVRLPLCNNPYATVAA